MGDEYRNLREGAQSYPHGVDLHSSSIWMIYFDFLQATLLSMSTLTSQSITFSRPGHLTPLPNSHDEPQLALVDPTIGSLEERRSALTYAPENLLRRKLFLVPTPSGIPGEEIEPGSAPQPSPLNELPPVRQTVERYVVGVVEIWGGRRSAMQLARSSHRKVYQKLLGLTGNQGTLPRIRKIYINEPIEGVVESAVTLRFDERVRSLVLRFEGVDKRWLCTQLELL